MFLDQGMGRGMATTAVPSYAFMPSSVTPLGTMFTTQAPAYQAVWPPPPMPPTSVDYFSPRLDYASSQVQFIQPWGQDVVPPPPLPPVSCEITSRIEALEKQRVMSLEVMREKDLEYDVVVSELKAKVELLEAKLRNQETTTRRKVEEAVRETEFIVRDEMRIEVQNTCDGVRRTYQEEKDRLQTELRQAEVLINDLRMKLETERAGQQRSSTSTSMALEDLQRQLEDRTNERNVLREDVEHLKRASSQREQESTKIRAALDDERKIIKMVSNERDTARAELEAVKSRTRLDEDGQRLRASFSGRPSFMEIPIATQNTTFEVDLTSGQDY